MSDEKLFDSEQDARDAFLRGELQWRRFSEAFTYKGPVSGAVRTVEGHETVRILDVTGIGPTGSPIFLAEKDDKSISTFESRELLSERELMWTEGKPSDYARWRAHRMQIKAEQEAYRAADKSLPIVTAALVT